RLLALFQPPRYGAWDPSPVMAVTFPIFVGLVIGDVGYGLLLFLLGWVFRNKARAGRTITIPVVNMRLPAPLAADASFLMAVLMLGTGGLLIFLGARGEQLPAGLGPIGIYLFLAAVGVSIVSLVVDRDVIKRILWLLESASGFGHILSHARLLAVGIAAAVLASSANLVGPQMAEQFGIPGIVGRIVGDLLAVVFQTMFLAFTFMGHIIQPARLHWRSE